VEDEKLQNLAQLVSGILQSVDSLQEHYVTKDIVDAHFNLVQDAVLIFNVHQAVIKANRAATKIIGVKTEESILGKHITEVITGPHNNHLFNCFKDMVESK
jgi:PAS domain S-box-containing protein